MPEYNTYQVSPPDGTVHARTDLKIDREYRVHELNGTLPGAQGKGDDTIDWRRLLEENPGMSVLDTPASEGIDIFAGVMRTDGDAIKDTSKYMGPRRPQFIGGTAPYGSFPDNQLKFSSLRPSHVERGVGALLGGGLGALAGNKLSPEDSFMHPGNPQRRRTNTLLGGAVGALGGGAGAGILGKHLRTRKATQNWDAVRDAVSSNAADDFADYRGTLARLQDSIERGDLEGMEPVRAQRLSDNVHTLASIERMRPRSVRTQARARYHKNITDTDKYPPFGLGRHADADAISKHLEDTLERRKFTLGQDHDLARGYQQSIDMHVADQSDLMNDADFWNQIGTQPPKTSSVVQDILTKQSTVPDSNGYLRAAMGGAAMGGAGGLLRGISEATKKDPIKSQSAVANYLATPEGQHRLQNDPTFAKMVVDNYSPALASLNAEQPSPAAVIAKNTVGGMGLGAVTGVAGEAARRLV